MFKYSFPLLSSTVLAWPSCQDPVEGIDASFFAAKFSDCPFAGAAAGAGWVESMEGERGLVGKEKLVDGIVAKEGRSMREDCLLSKSEVVDRPNTGQAPMHGWELCGISSS